MKTLLQVETLENRDNPSSAISNWNGPVTTASFYPEVGYPGDPEISQANVPLNINVTGPGGEMATITNSKGDVLASFLPVNPDMREGISVAIISYGAVQGVLAGTPRPSDYIVFGGMNGAGPVLEIDQTTWVNGQLTLIPRHIALSFGDTYRAGVQISSVDDQLNGGPTDQFSRMLVYPANSSGLDSQGKSRVIVVDPVTGNEERSFYVTPVPQPYTSNTLTNMAATNTPFVPYFEPSAGLSTISTSNGLVLCLAFDVGPLSKNSDGVEYQDTEQISYDISKNDFGTIEQINLSNGDILTPGNGLSV